MPDDKEFELDDLESFSFDDISLDEPAPDAEDTAQDPLGVWVKKAPEDVDSPEFDVSDLAEPEFALPDLDLTDLDALSSPGATGDEATDAFDSSLEPSTPDEGLAEEDFLSSEELANLDDSFDFVTVEEPLEGESPLDAEPAPGAQAFDEVSLDDFVGFEDPTGEAAAPEVPEDEPEEGEVEDFLDIDIAIEDDIKDDELEILEGGAPAFEDEFDVPDTFSAETVDLSEFADFEELAPLSPEAQEPEEDELPEVKDLPTFEPDPAHEHGFFEEKVLDDALPSIDLEPADHTDLDHIMALEETLTSGFREPEVTAEATPEPRAQDTTQAAPPVAPQGATDLAALILGKLEQELSSIKKEISDLKKEVTSLRTPGTTEADADLPPPTDESVTEVTTHGFFDEEDDETIALTGDELDNILSTAEVSEGEETGVSLDEDLLGLDGDGNLVEPEGEDEEFHVTDEEFLAGTSLDLNEPGFDLDATETDVEQESLGVPESIELEEVDLPQGLDAGETDDLLAQIGPPPEEFFDDSTSLEIPSDLELGELSPPEAPLVEEPLDLEDEAPVPEAEDEPAFEAPAEDAIPEPLLEDIEAPAPLPPEAPAAPNTGLSPALKDELRAVLSYMDKLLASLPDEKIQEFAESEHFEVYKKLFEELGLIE